MLYLLSTQTQLSPLPAVPGLHIRENKDARFMAAMGQTSPEEAGNRFAAGHKAYVAYLNDQPAAFGWVATQKARIGELNHEFSLPYRHQYLWNFRTREEFRGLGIYPTLLRAILQAELPNTDCFWIMHAPENKASQRGILKAGFTFSGQVSVLPGSEVIFDSDKRPSELNEVLETFGFQPSSEPQATCWNCSSPYLKNRKPGCCCAAESKVCTRNLFAEV